MAEMRPASMLSWPSSGPMVRSSYHADRSAKEAGIALTGSGSSFPLKDDPNDRNIRLAPSLPPLDEVRTAMDGVATCVLLACVEAAEAQAG